MVKAMPRFPSITIRSSLMKRSTSLAKTFFVALGVAGVLFLTGCLERSETIKVRPDGQVSMTVNIKADQVAELSPGRVPSQLSGWTVNQAPDADGKKQTLSAQQTFAPGYALPANDGTPGDLLNKTYVQFPTTLKVEKRSDGTYYQFRRVYQARPYAWLAALDERPGSNEIKAITQRPADKVTLGEWEKAIAFAMETQTLKKLEQARAAVLQITPDLPQDKWLKARQNVLDIGRKTDTAKLATMLQSQKPGTETASHQAITQEIQTLEANLDKALIDAMTAAGYNSAGITKLKGLMNQSKSQETATNDARATTYKITVELPGDAVGSNATQASGSAFTWEFKGDAFFDRDLELLATTKVK